MSTPMTRTAQTLLSVMAGAGWTDRMEHIEISDLALGMGTLYEKDFHVDRIISGLAGGKGLGLKGLKGLEVCQLYSKFMATDKQIPGIKPFAEGACLQLAFLKTLLDRQKEQSAPIGLSILAAHDLNLANLIGHCFGLKEFTAETWPPFLDGVLLQISPEDSGDRVTITYGDKSVDIDVKKENS